MGTETLDVECHVKKHGGVHPVDIEIKVLMECKASGNTASHIVICKFLVFNANVIARWSHLNIQPNHSLEDYRGWYD